eukprot:537405_1
MAAHYVEMKAIHHEDNASDSSGEHKGAEREEHKRAETEEVLVMDLERQSYYMRSWKPCKLRIHAWKPPGATVNIDDDYFKDYAETYSLRLNKCTISFTTKNKCAELRLKYRNGAIDLTTLFRLPFDENDSDDTVKQKIRTFTLFVATLAHYGSQFDRLKAALERWNKGKRKATQSEIIHICKLKYGYDMFQNRNDLDAYVHMIQNMNEMLIKPLQCILRLKEFSEKEPGEWNARCLKALQIECRWKRLASQITVHLEKMRRITQSGTDEMQYEQIQNILKALNREAARFFDEYIAPEIVAWCKIANKYKELARVQSSTSGHQLKIIVGICLGLIAIGTIVALFVCPPVGLLAGGATGAAVATTTTAVTTTTTTSATVYAAGFWWCIGGLGALGLGCAGLTAKGWKEYSNLRDNKVYYDSERVLQLWEKFKNEYLTILSKVDIVATKETGVEFEGFNGKDVEKELMEKNIEEIALLSKQCIAEIKRSKS